MAVFRIDQDSYAFYSDGTESGSVIIGSANNSIIVGDEVGTDKPFDTPILIRFLIQEYGGKAGSSAFRLQASKNSGAYAALSAVSGVTAVDSVNLTPGDDCTQRIGAGTFVSNNNGVGDNTDSGTAAFGVSEESECLFTFEIDEALVADGDTFEFRVVDTADAVMDTYTNIGLVTVDKVVGPATLVVQDSAQVQVPENVVLSIPGILLDIDHEGNNLNEWDGTVGIPAATAGSALAGTNYGMNVPVSGGTTSYAYAAIDLTGKTVCRFRIYFDPNSYSIDTGGDTHNIAAVRANIISNALMVDCNYDVTYGQAIRINLFSDGNSPNASSYYDLTDEPHWIEVIITRATNATSNDGSAQFWVDDVSKETVSGVDNYDAFVDMDELRLGIMNANVNMSGAIYIDEVIFLDAGTYIGPVGGGATPLVVQDVAQAQVVDNVVLTQHQVLVVADSAQAQTTENVVLAQNYGPLTVADVAQAQAIENVVLVQHQVLVVADSAHAQAIEEPALTQHQVLVVDDSAQLQTVENVDLVQHQVLVVADVAQAQATENVVLTAYPPGANLVVQDSAQAQAVENVALVQHQVLVVDDVTQVQTSENVDLVQHQVLVVADLAQAQATDNVVLTAYLPGATPLVVQDVAQSQATENVALTQHQVLAVDDSAQLQTSENVDLAQNYGPLVVADVAQAQTTEGADLVQHHVLAVDDVVQLQTSENVDLVQHYGALVVADSAQAQSTENVVLVYHPPGSVGLVVQDVAQVQSIDNVSLTQHHVLLVGDVVQLQSADNVTLTPILVPADMVQAQASDNVSLLQHHVIVVADSAQAQFTDNVNMTGVAGVRKSVRFLQSTPLGR